MPESPHKDSQQDKEAQVDKGVNGNDSTLQVRPITLPSGLRWTFIVGGVFLVGLLAVSLFLPNLTERVKFFTVNALSLFVLLVIAVQTYIYLRQSETMEKGIAISEQALRVSNRAYVGVHSISEDFKGERIILTVENTGNVPAENLKVTGDVWVIIPRKGGLAALRNPWFESANCAFTRRFQNTRLFRGNLKAQVTIDLFKISVANKTYIPSVAEGHGTLWLVGHIEYGDGFAPGQISQFAFSYDKGEWAARGVDNPEVMKKEKQPKEK